MWPCWDPAVTSLSLQAFALSGCKFLFRARFGFLLLLASECAIARLCIDNKIELFHEPPESSMIALLILGYDVTSRPPWALASLGYRFFLKSECGLARYSLPHAPSFVCVRPISTIMSHSFICLRRVTSHVIIQKVPISTVFVRCAARWLFQIITTSSWLD